MCVCVAIRACYIIIITVISTYLLFEKQKSSKKGPPRARAQIIELRSNECLLDCAPNWFTRIDFKNSYTQQSIPMRIAFDFEMHFRSLTKINKSKFGLDFIWLFVKMYQSVM